MIRSAILWSGALALAACSRTPSPAAPAPAPVPPAAPAAPAPAAPVPAAAPAAATAVDLAGIWDFTVDTGGQVLPGDMTLQRSGTTYGGTVSPQGMGTLDIRSVVISGMRVVIVVDTPDGEAVMDAVLAADGRSLSGAVAVQGQPMPFSARKR